ncbi:hypothetical protein LZ32DRAFT_6322 [Colletotrichum eremochloae]|nr:hypothetical protein LZ32DRAFT_6322 [Colletotrichum eremochloae]
MDGPCCNLRNPSHHCHFQPGGRHVWRARAHFAQARRTYYAMYLGFNCSRLLYTTAFTSCSFCSVTASTLGAVLSHSPARSHSSVACQLPAPTISSALARSANPSRLLSLQLLRLVVVASRDITQYLCSGEFELGGGREEKMRKLSRPRTASPSRDIGWTAFFCKLVVIR